MLYTCSFVAPDVRASAFASYVLCYSPLSLSHILQVSSLRKTGAPSPFCLSFFPPKQRSKRQRGRKHHEEVNSHESSGMNCSSAQIFKKEGPAGFFGGFSAYYGRCAPHAMIILLSIEGITKGYKNLLGLN